MSNFVDRFTQLTKDFAKDYDKTDADIAALLGVSKQTVSAWKNGTRSPKKPTIVAIANRMNVSIEWLMGLDVPRNPLPLGVAARRQKPADEPKQQPSIDELISQLQELKRRQCAGAYNLTQDEQELIDDYRTLSQPMKLKARKIIGALADRTEG